MPSQPPHVAHFSRLRRRKRRPRRRSGRRSRRRWSACGARPQRCAARRRRHNGGLDGTALRGHRFDVSTVASTAQGCTCGAPTSETRLLTGLPSACLATPMSPPADRPPVLPALLRAGRGTEARRGGGQGGGGAQGAGGEAAARGAAVPGGGVGGVGVGGARWPASLGEGRAVPRAAGGQQGHHAPNQQPTALQRGGHAVGAAAEGTFKAQSRVGQALAT